MAHLVWHLGERRRRRWVDPRCRWRRERLRPLAHEPLRVSGVGRREHDTPLFEDLVDVAVVNRGGREQAERVVPVLGVVPGEEALAERPDVLEGAEALGKRRVILRVLNWASE